MRGLAPITVMVLFLGACWAKFPDDRMAPDGSAPTADVGQRDATPAADQKGVDTVIKDTGPREGGQSDVRPHDLFNIPDAFNCTPGAFVQCVAKDQIQVCNKKGDGVDVESCAPFDCNPTAGRCNECDPNAPATCVGPNLVSCTAAGLPQTTPCPQGCQNGACCVDVDKDGHTDCAGDCDDNDPKVFPGQTAWQTTATSSGSFDYNCDSTEELQYPGPVSCQIDKGSCVGAGWEGATVPACGKPGPLTTCKKQGNKCVTDATSQATQGCR
jgi:hypothetical protein